MMQRPTEDFGLKFQDADTVLERDDFERAESIDDVERTLEEKGVLEGTAGKAREAKVYRKARKSWRKLTRRNIGEVETKELPSYSTTVNGEELHVHGYNHGFTWLPANGKVRKQLTDTVEKHVDENKVLFEEYLPNHLKNQSLTEKRNFRELDDIKWAFPRERSKAEAPEELKQKFATSKFDKIRGMLPTAHTGQTTVRDRVFGAGKTLRIYSMSAMNRRFNHFSYDMAHSMNRSRKNPDYSLDHLNCARANMLPLKLEENLIGQNAKLDVLTTQRSIYQAERALQAEGDTHLIVGTGHVPQIEDYIDRVKERGRRANLPPV